MFNKFMGYVIDVWIIIATVVVFMTVGIFTLAFVLPSAIGGLVILFFATIAAAGTKMFLECIRK